MEEILNSKYMILGFKTIIYILIGIIIYNFFKGIIIKIINKRVKNKKENPKITTIRSMILNIIKYVILIIILLAILANWGVNVTSLVAGLGVTGAIIGLAFQDLAKDIIAGVSIIAEDQYEVGDTIQIDDFIGTVTAVGLKTTKIRNYAGATYIVANHSITKLINYSLNDTLAVIDVSTPYEEDSEKIEKVLNKMKEELTDIPNATGSLDILGINELADSAVVYRIVVPVKPAKHFETERYLRKQIRTYFKENKINIPYNQIEVHNGK